MISKTEHKHGSRRARATKGIPFVKGEPLKSKSDYTSTRQYELAKKHTHRERVAAEKERVAAAMKERDKQNKK